MHSADSRSPASPVRGIASPDGSAWPPSRSRRIYRSRHGGDWMMMALFAAMPLATGLDIWFQLGWASTTGRAAFWGLAIMAALAGWTVYAAKIGIRVLVSSDGLTVVHGPRRWHLRWEETSRLLERSQLVNGQRYRWVVIEARDGRRLQVREDRVTDYARLREDVYATYQLWRDEAHKLRTEWNQWNSDLLVDSEGPGPIRYLGYASLVLASTAAFLWTMIPTARFLGAALVIGAIALGSLRVGEWLRRQTVAVDRSGIEAHRPLQSGRLEWTDISRVERRRLPVRLMAGALARGIAISSSLLGRSTGWTGGAPWPRRVPEQLVLRAAGRQIRIRLSRLERPDELLAQVDRRTGGTLRRGAVTRRLTHGRPTSRLAEVAPEAPSPVVGRSSDPPPASERSP